MYGDDELDKAFEQVHDHFGRNYSVTEVLRQLVRDKARDIDAGNTRRAQIAGLRADLETWVSDITGQIALIDERQSLLVEMMRQLVAGGVQADALFCAVESAAGEDEE